MAVSCSLAPVRRKLDEKQDFGDYDPVGLDWEGVCGQCHGHGHETVHVTCGKGPLPAMAVRLLASAAKGRCDCMMRVGAATQRVDVQTSAGWYALQCKLYAFIYALERDGLNCSRGGSCRAGRGRHM